MRRKTKSNRRIKGIDKSFPLILGLSEQLNCDLHVKAHLYAAAFNLDIWARVLTLQSLLFEKQQEKLLKRRG